MEPFIVGTGIGCLIGIATAYLIISRPESEEPPSWREIIDSQMDALEKIEGDRIKPRALTRLTNHHGSIEL
jgi:hypothetical protein